MSEEQQELWLRAAADSLDGIRPEEVKKVAAEVKRSVMHHQKIVPTIAQLVADHRKRPTMGDGRMTALQYAQRAHEYGLPKHYEAWMEEARRGGEI